MSVPIVKSCCCGCSLHTGTLIIGCFYTVWALLELLGFALMATMWPLGAPARLSVHKYVFYIAAAAVSGLHMLCSILLVPAAIKKLASLTLPWTMVTGVITAVYFVICLTGTSLILQDSGRVLVLEIVVLCACFVRTCVSVYCIVVVHSRHKQMMYEQNEERFQHSGKIYKAVVTDDTGV